MQVNQLPTTKNAAAERVLAAIAAAEFMMTGSFPAARGELRLARSHTPDEGCQRRLGYHG